MSRIETSLSIALICFLGVLQPTASFAQETAEVYLDAAKDAYIAAIATTGEEKGASFRKVQTILDRIVDTYPQSDLALDILLRRPIEGIDLVEVDAEIRKASTARALALKRLVDSNLTSTKLSSENNKIATTSAGGSVMPQTLRNDSGVEPVSLPQNGYGASPKESMPPQAPQAPQASRSSAETEKSLKLDRQAVRDIQARLLVIGHDPNGVDGVLGKGTRSAVRAWQASSGMASTGFLNESQLTALKEQSQASLDAWLKIRKNANLYTPPKQPKQTSGKPARSNTSGWYRDNRGLYCKRGNFGKYCQRWKPRELR